MKEARKQWQWILLGAIIGWLVGKYGPLAPLVAVGLWGLLWVLAAVSAVLMIPFFLLFAAPGVIRRVREERAHRRQYPYTRWSWFEAVMGPEFSNWQHDRRMAAAMRRDEKTRRAK